MSAIPWQPLGALLLAAAALMGSPGPATISLTAAGSTYGVRRSLRYLAGIIGGTWVVLAAGAAGITAPLLAVAGLRPLLLVLSAGYVLWLAYHVATAPPLAAQRASADAPTLGGGLLLGVANPKAWVAIAAVFASARLASSAVLDAAGKAAVLAV